MTCGCSGGVTRGWRVVSPAASAGSADLPASGKGPGCSINFVTCHDGFTLNDLVSYSRKHNDANGEDNRDGTDENHSDNHGVEGETQDHAIEKVRRRQIKNFLLTLTLSRGVPMLLAGHEFRRSQQGNNNAYCQDNHTSWVDWSLLPSGIGALVRFTRQMLAFRRRHPVLATRSVATPIVDIQWFDAGEGRAPDRAEAKQKSAWPAGSTTTTV